MDKPIIEVKNLGKKYDITHQRGGYVALRDVLSNVIKHPLQFAGSKARQIIGKENREEFWALKNVNFEIKRGEVVGVIGHNGAGKSTFLKILSQITPPTTGEIKIRGTIGSLLEVGTGFHPELTGRENIIMNGAILGMTKKEIEKKFNDIVEFSGIEKFLDTPVKYYSSGMYVRLAFSVAAHLEPEILLIDEVLAVGDAEFQKKCLGKMSEVTKKEGRTILFVSHNMSAVQQLCKKCILLEKGQIKEYGETNEIIKKYIYNDNSDSDLTRKQRAGSGEIKLQSIGLVTDDLAPKKNLNFEDALNFLIGFNANEPVKDVTISIAIYSISGDLVANIHSFNELKNKTLQGEGKIIVSLGKINLLPGNYKINISVHSNGTSLSLADHIVDAFSFNVVSETIFPQWVKNSILLKAEWKILS